MIRHIAGIVQRKGSEDTARNRGVSLNEHRQHTNKYLAEEKREIARQNQILIQKINEYKSKKMTKKDLKKQFKVYESHKNLLRKVHYETSEKEKRRKEKSVDLEDREDKEHSD